MGPEVSEDPFPHHIPQARLRGRTGQAPNRRRQSPRGRPSPLPNPPHLEVQAAYIRSHGSFSASTSSISRSSRPLKLLSKRTSSSNTRTWARPLATTCNNGAGRGEALYTQAVPFHLPDTDRLSLASVICQRLSPGHVPQLLQSLLGLPPPGD